MSKVYYNHTSKLEAVKAGFAPAATIALQKVGNNFIYGISICSAYDNFSKKYGREIATARMEKGFKITPIPESLLKEVESLGAEEEKAMCLAFLYQLAYSVTTKSRRWKKKITRFNKEQATPVVDITKKYDSDADVQSWSSPTSPEERA